MFKKNYLFQNKKEDEKIDLQLEKGDGLAIVIAAFITIMPALLLVFSIFALFIIWFVK